LQNILQEICIGKMGATQRPAPGWRRLLALDASCGQIGGDVREHLIDLGAEQRNRSDTHDGDLANEQAILDEGRALLVVDET
jgi:hypothetical protein